MQMITLTLFAVQCGFGELRYLARDNRWAASGDLDILLFTTHAETMAWIDQHHADDSLCARSPIAVPYPADVTI